MRERRMKLRSYQLGLLAFALAACRPAREPAVDPALASEIQNIHAIDNHAHPVRYTAAGETPDREFDALPVDNMELQSDPVALRPGSAAVVDAAQALFQGTPKAQVLAQRGDGYP